MRMTRRATVADASSIARVGVRSWRVAYRGIMPQDFLDRLDVGKGAETWRATISNTEEDVLVVDDEDGVAGFCWLTRAGHSAGEIVALYVDPDKWNRGLGAALVAGALQCARGREFRIAMLWSMERNVRARRFYESQGFREHGSRRTNERWGIALEELRYDVAVDVSAPRS
jgi:ribosomal protein S18 acetylase RimI-like enzyme